MYVSGLGLDHRLHIRRKLIQLKGIYMFTLEVRERSFLSINTTREFDPREMMYNKVVKQDGSMEACVKEKERDTCI